MDKYMYWLDRIEGLGSRGKRSLLEAFGSAREVYYGQEKYMKYLLEEKKQALFLQAKRDLEVDKPFDELWRQRIEMVCIEEQNYPEKLKMIPDPPFALYYKGRLPAENLPYVAIIGARECSQYGEYVAQELGKMLGVYGVQVISGMARGIDGISQLAALAAGGISYGVLGCGVDICYPKSNHELYEKLIQEGGILSEYVPKTKPLARLFPARNRIVSGLADVLVVIEARQKSGTAITVEMALEQGREIYAVPGRITDRLSDGCNKMLKEGAHVFLSPEDLLLDLQEMLPMKMAQLKGENVYNTGTEECRKQKASVGQREERGLLDIALENILDFYPQSIEEITDKLKTKHHIECKQEELLSKLIYMCLFGQAKQEGQGWFSKGEK